MVLEYATGSSGTRAWFECGNFFPVDPHGLEFQEIKKLPSKLVASSKHHGDPHCIVVDGLDRMVVFRIWELGSRTPAFPELADSDRVYPCRGSIILADDIDASGRTEPEAAQMG